MWNVMEMEHKQNSTAEHSEFSNKTEQQQMLLLAASALQTKSHAINAVMIELLLAK